MKKSILIVTIIASTIFLGCKEKQSQKEEKTVTAKNSIEPKINMLDEELLSVINIKNKIEILTEETFGWSEGPVWIEEYQMLLFSDVPKNIIYKYTDAYGLEKYLEPSGNTGVSEGGNGGSNGLLLSPKGELVLCQHGDRRISIMNASFDNPESKFTSIVSSYKGKKLNSPNDAAYHSNGDLFFTDPPYGLGGKDTSEFKEIKYNGVYKVDTEGNISLIDSTLTRPNGIAFSPDYKKLYVANSDPKSALWKVYDVDEKGNILRGEVLNDVTNLVSDEFPGLPDGLKVDDNGNLFASGPGGVLILSPEGKHLGTINTIKKTANCAFNEDKSELYMTSHSQLMRLKIK
jgi:gluconolactonase